MKESDSIAPVSIDEVVLGDSEISVNQFVAVARYGATVSFSADYCVRVRKSRTLLDKFLEEKRIIYGVTTGFGENVKEVISPEDAETLQRNIVRSHAVSVGEPLKKELVRGIQLMKLISLGKGYSGASLELLEQIRALLNQQITPFVPSEGSVGYLSLEAQMALVLIGEGRAWCNGELISGMEALGRAGLTPYSLRCKEGLCLTNGTTSVTAVATLAVYNSIQAAYVADIASAMVLEVLKGTTNAFDPRYHSVKAHDEQAATARNVLKILADSAIAKRNCDYRLQDFYGLRCIPQAHGAVKKYIKDVSVSIANELKSSGDNPIIFPVGEDGLAISGANFDGSFVGIGADLLTIAMANLAKFSERRTDRMVNPSFSELPAFLVHSAGLNSGYMITQYTSAGLLGEIKILSHPATADSIPTSGNQEDPISGAYLAAKKAYDVSRKLQNILAIELMTATQALDFFDPADASSATRAVYNLIRSVVPKVTEDRHFYPDIMAVLDKVQEGEITAEVEKVVGALEF